MTTHTPHIRWEVWISDEGNDTWYTPQNGWRFNACFDSRQQAEAEASWYHRHGYVLIDIRVRTTRYQKNEHVTSG